MSGTGKMKKPGCSGGFTLLELLIVALMLGIISTMASPFFKRAFMSLEYENYAFMLQRMLQYTRTMAIVEGVEYRVRVDTKNNSYWMEKNMSGETAVKGFSRVSGRFGGVFYAPQCVSISGTPEAVGFFPDGASEGAEYKITLSAGDFYVLRIISSTGTVIIEEGNSDEGQGISSI